MQMNIRKGLLRLWIVGSILFVICLFPVSYRSLRGEFRIANTDYDAIAKELGGSYLLPTDCTKARGLLGTDYTQMQISAGTTRRISGVFIRITPRTIKLFTAALCTSCPTRLIAPVYDFTAFSRRAPPRLLKHTTIRFS